MRVLMSFLRGLDAEIFYFDRHWEALQMKAFEARSEAQQNTNACDRIILISRFVAIGKVQYRRAPRPKWLKICQKTHT